VPAVGQDPGGPFGALGVVGRWYELPGKEGGEEVVAGVGEGFAIATVAGAGVMGLGRCCHGGRLSVVAASQGSDDFVKLISFSLALIASAWSGWGYQHIHIF
jgi:hypothetical protein